MWTRSVFGAVLVLLAAACGNVTAGPAAGGKTTPTGASGPASTRTPDNATAGGLSLLSTSWVTASQGWALAAGPCGEGSCARLRYTSDLGRRWQARPNPGARIQDGSVDCSVQTCVSQIGFATPETGYLYGPALLMTTDGGLSWKAQPGPQTEALTIAGDQVYRVTYTNTGCPGPCQPSLQQATVGSANWRTLIEQLTEPGRSDSAQIVVSGSDVLVAMYGSLAGPIPAQAVVYRSTDGGSTWRQGADPCSKLGPSGPQQEEDLIGLAAAPGGPAVGLCAPHNNTTTFVITSADGGATWRATAADPRGQFLGVVAAARPATIAVATATVSGNGTSTARLLVTTDLGQHWVTAATDTQDLSAGNPITSSVPAWLEFENSLTGQWLGDPHGIWTTTDGGLQWTRSAFR